MLSTLSRIFQPSSSSSSSVRSHEQDPLAGAEAGITDSSSTSRRSNDDPRLSLDTHSDSTPLLSRKLSHVSSSAATIADAHHPGPPHIQWKTPQSRYQSGQNSPAKSMSNVSMALYTPTTPGWGAQPMSRSASSPSLPLSPLSNASASQAYRPSSLGRQSSHSLRLAGDSMCASEDSDMESDRSIRNGNGSHSLPKQLSPIHEQQVPFPPHRKLSLDSVPRTPDSTRTFDRITGQAAAHNAFINRPLKRSISQTSTTTHRSNISAAPPVIPPIDLNPNFQHAMGIGPPHAPSPIVTQPAPIPRKSRLPPPSLPTVVGSPPRLNMVSVIYEDGASARTSSFITAPSPTTPSGETGQRYSLGLELANMYVDPSAIRTPSSSAGTDAGETEETDVTHHALPAGLYDVDISDEHQHQHLHPHPGSQPQSQSQSRPSSHPSLRPDNPVPPSTRSGSQVTLSVPNTHPRSRSGSDESFLEKRWLKGLSFGSDRFVFPPGCQREAGYTPAFVLFWIGFVAPWCWLIGGWLLTGDGDVPEDKRTHGFLLPLWKRRTHRGMQPVRTDDGMLEGATKRDGKRRADAGPEVGQERRGAADRRSKSKSKSWYPLFAPSVESLAPSANSRGSARWMKRCSLPGAGRMVDPWIARCRMAALVSSVLIFAAFVVSVVLVAGVRM